MAGRAPRKKFTTTALLLGFALAGCATQSQTTDGITLERGGPSLGPSQDLVANSARAIGKVQTTAGEGLGFVIDPAGVILTNRHVIEDGEHILSFELPDAVPPQRFEAVRVVYTDVARDLALLEVDATSPLPSLPLATLDFEAPEDYLRTGATVTIAKSMHDDDEAERSEARSFELAKGKVRSVDTEVPAVEPGPFIELGHDVVAGQSGGPVLDKRGRAVGVVTWTWRHEVGGFAVPIAEVHRMLQERPDVGTPRTLERRARQRAEAYMSALADEQMHAARNLTSPSHARSVRGQTVATLLEGQDPESSVIVTWVEMLEQVVEATKGDERAAFNALNALAARIADEKVSAALGLDTVPAAQRLSFFLELGQGYLAARLFGGQDMRGALMRGLTRLQSLEAARSFALANVVLGVSQMQLRIERVDVHPGLYAPTAVAFLRVVGGDGKPTGQRLALELKMEWGDWYVGDLQPVSAG